MEVGTEELLRSIMKKLLSFRFQHLPWLDEMQVKQKIVKASPESTVFFTMSHSVPIPESNFQTFNESNFVKL